MLIIAIPVTSGGLIVSDADVSLLHHFIRTVQAESERGWDNKMIIKQASKVFDLFNPKTTDFLCCRSHGHYLGFYRADKLTRGQALSILEVEAQEGSDTPC